MAFELFRLDMVFTFSIFLNKLCFVMYCADNVTTGIKSFILVIGNIFAAAAVYITQLSTQTRAVAPVPSITILPLGSICALP